jgi:hypothetical protein
MIFLKNIKTGTIIRISDEQSFSVSTTDKIWKRTTFEKWKSGKRVSEMIENQ